jgi:hypothetical protein
MGAGRGRLIQQLFAESIVLACRYVSAAGGAGLFLRSLGKLASVFGLRRSWGLV